MTITLLDIQREQDLKCLDGTPLQGVTLDQLLQNVRDNECYQEQDEIARIQDEVQRLYLGYVAARAIPSTSKKPNQISRQYHVPLPTVITWINGRFPTKLKGYTRSLLPKTQAQKRAFAYVLGVVSSHAPSGEVQETIFRVHESAKTRTTLTDAVDAAIGYEPVVKGNRVCINHTGFSQLVRGLQQRSLRDYITSTDEANAFLKGFLDFSHIEPHLKLRRRTGETPMVYTITSHSPVIYEALVWSLHQLRIYPLLTKAQIKIEIKGRVDLRLLAGSSVVSDEVKTTLYAYLSQRREVQDPLRWYYEIRKDTEARKQSPSGLNIADVVRSFPKVRETTLKKWAADIIGYGDIRVPFRLRRYEAVCKYLGIEKTQREKGSTNHEPKKSMAGKPYQEINVNGSVYYLSAGLLHHYLKEYGIEQFDDDSRQHIGYEIQRNLRGDPRRDLIIEINPQRVITRLILRDDKFT